MKGIVLGFFGALGAFLLGYQCVSLVARGLESLGQGYGEGTQQIAPLVAIGSAAVAFSLTRKKYGKSASDD